MRESKGLENPIVPSLFSMAREEGLELYAVGGAVRDRLLQRSPSGDIDFVYKGGSIDRVVGRLQKRVRFKAVPFDNKGFSTLRLCFKSLIIDFQPLHVSGLYQDALHRDFTVNALYLEQKQKGLTLLDPLNGEKDLADGLLKETSEQSFDQDPLRILRLFRFASQLGFRYEKGTLRLAAGSVQKLSRISPERIKDELIKIFSKPMQGLLSDMSDLCLFDLLAGFHPRSVPEFPAGESVINLFLLFSENGRSGAFVSFLKAFRFSKKDIEVAAALHLLEETEEEAVIGRFHKKSSWLLERLKDFCLMTRQKGKRERLEDISCYGSPLIDGREAARLFHVSGPALGALMDALHILQIEKRLTRKEELILAAEKRNGKEY
ncbi:MAG TPA: CCA tRNA nucleotidyltransferase [Firmicutes bacterium]|nr:CCA tRNA nucleotidyltransferase [Bacillota bacterium]